ncbi:MAG TPA: ThiF family adenylyltransferase [Xanthobacteraceae bacterium]|nr:ThiF family adenylyltransferase [Xanthobacteraceae bacterium]
MGLHPWWSGFGEAVASTDDLTWVPAREMASAVAAGTIPGVTLTEMKACAQSGRVAVALAIEVERPQDLAHPIRATEPVAVVFEAQGGQPRVLALRDDFPDTPHQNWTPPDAPCSLCVDDRPWAEARLTYRPADFIRRIQLWLAKAARGELHDTAQPPDPLFFVSQLGIVVPRAASVTGADPVELIGFVRSDNQALILTRTVAEAEPRRKGQPGFVVIGLRAKPQSMTRLRHAPVTLAALHAELQPAGINVIDEIKARLRAWAGIAHDSVRRLSSRLAILVAFPITTADGKTTDDLRAFISLETAGQIGVQWGLLHNTKAAGVAGDDDVFLRAVPEGAPAPGDIKIEPAQVHLAFDRELAAAVAGHAEPDRRRAVLVGAGALGSQIAMNMAREGAFTWTVVDSDWLLPHNLARHALLANELGAPKALALARQMGWLLNESFTAVAGDVAKPDAELVRELAEADVIIDASASVAVSRHLADLENSPARRLCVFFNPAGTAVVLFAESRDRAITLRDLEAQYHRLVQTEPALNDHLRAGPGLRYSGSCRALTNRIPATSAALLSALGARGLAEALTSDVATLRIWKVGTASTVQLIERHGSATHRVDLAEWSISYDDGLLAELASLRASRLPRETGGVLLGIADMSRKSIHVAHALPEPEDSRGSPQGFERGVVGLKAAVNRAVESSLHQLSYVGEWHSHPARSSPMPSGIDLAQIVWLGNELEYEGLPGLMAIAADNGAFAFVLSPGSRVP